MLSRSIYIDYRQSFASRKSSKSKRLSPILEVLENSSTTPLVETVAQTLSTQVVCVMLRYLLCIFFFCSSMLLKRGKGAKIDLIAQSRDMTYQTMTCLITADGRH